MRVVVIRDFDALGDRLAGTPAIMREVARIARRKGWGLTLRVARPSLWPKFGVQRLLSGPRAHLRKCGLW